MDAQNFFGAGHADFFAREVDDDFYGRREFGVDGRDGGGVVGYYCAEARVVGFEVGF